jgi:hypothetical protein
VWIIDVPDSTAPGYFPIMAGSTTNFSRPYVMTYPSGAFPTDEPTPQIHVRHLQVTGGQSTGQPTVPDRQLWGVHSGVLPQ